MELHSELDDPCGNSLKPPADRAECERLQVQVKLNWRRVEVVGGIEDFSAQFHPLLVSEVQHPGEGEIYVDDAGKADGSGAGRGSEATEWCGGESIRVEPAGIAAFAMGEVAALSVEAVRP